MSKDPKSWFELAAISIPKPYKLTPRAVMLNDRVVSSTPFMLEAVLVSTEGDKLYLVAWMVRTPGGVKIKRHVAPRQAWTTTRGLSWSVGNGFDGGSNNAKDIAAILTRQEAELPDNRVFEYASQMGWDQDKTRFLIGQECLTEDEVLPADPMFPRDQASMYLDPAVPTLMTDGFFAAGSMDEWAKAAKLAGKYPRVALALYASLLPPIQSILGAENFAVVWSGPSSTGKSTCISMASSVWGNPDTMEPPSSTMLWNEKTDTVERWASVMKDMPCIIDDLGAGGFINADAKLKAAVCGVNEAMQWKTVVIATGVSTGDDDALSDSMAARVLNLWGPPFGRIDSASAADVVAMGNLVKANHGLAGPRFVQAVLANRASWPKWRESYLKNKADAISRAADMGGVASRLAGHVAAIATAAMVVQALMPDVFTWDFRPTVRDLWEWLALSGPTSSRARLATDLTKEFVAENWRQFHGVRPEAEGVPMGGFYGKVNTDGTVMVGLARLNQLLVESGFKPHDIYSEWLNTDAIQRYGAGYVHRVGLSGTPLRVVHFKAPWAQVKKITSA